MDSPSKSRPTKKEKSFAGMRDSLPGLIMKPRDVNPEMLLMGQQVEPVNLKPFNDAITVEAKPDRNSIAGVLGKLISRPPSFPRKSKKDEIADDIDFSHDMVYQTTENVQSVVNKNDPGTKKNREHHRSQSIEISQLDIYPESEVMKNYTISKSRPLLPDGTINPFKRAAHNIPSDDSYQTDSKLGGQVSSESDKTTPRSSIEIRRIPPKKRVHGTAMMKRAFGSFFSNDKNLTPTNDIREKKGIIDDFSILDAYTGAVPQSIEPDIYDATSPPQKSIRKIEFLTHSPSKKNNAVSRGLSRLLSRSTSHFHDGGNGGKNGRGDSSEEEKRDSLKHINPETVGIGIRQEGDMDLNDALVLVLMHPKNPSSSSIFVTSEKYDAAIRANEEEIARLELLGDTNPEVILLKAATADWYKGLGMPKAAEILLRQVIDAQKRVLPPGHPDISSSTNDLCLLLISMHRYEEAYAVGKETLAAVIDTQGFDHVDVACVWGNVAVALRYQENYQESVAAHENAVAILEMRYGPNHPDTVYQRAQMGVTHIRLGAIQKGKRIVKDSMLLFRDVLSLPDTHPWINTFKEYN